MLSSSTKAVQDANWLDYIVRTSKGDQSAFASLYDESSKLIYSIILMIVRSPEDAEEVMLDVYTSVWNNARAFDTSRGSVAGWLVVLARSRAIDRIRSRAWRQRSHQSAESFDYVKEDGLSPEAQLLDRERYGLLHAAMSTLPSEERELLVHAFFRGLTHRELAESTRQPLGTVKTKIRTAMIKLRSRLATKQPEALSA